MVDPASLSTASATELTELFERHAEAYVELHLHTCYSLLEGASQPWELTEQAKRYGYRTLAITDRNNLYGAMEFTQRCRDDGIRPIIGVELTVESPDARRHDLTLLAEDQRGYANLCRLVSMANGWGLAEQSEREERRTDPRVTFDQLREHTAGVICLTGGRNGELASRLDAGDRAGAAACLQRWIDWFGRDNVWVELHDNLVLGDRPRIRAQVALARRLDVGVVATGDVHYHQEDRHRLHDALCAIRHRTTLDGCHVQRRPNSEFYLRSPAEQQRRFAEWPDAVHNSVRIADRCTFDLLDDLGYRLPTPPVEAGHTPDSWLRELCTRALEARYRGSDKLDAARKRLDEELQLIARHQLAGFFLVYHEVLGLAREVAEQVRGGSPRGRLNMAPGRGRGSSVSSIVCYLIGLSHIDPIENDLFLGRFLNDSMTSLPDIDLDFPRDIRDQLFQRVYEHWGTDHAALVATFPRYRIRSAVRDLGKALGLPGAEVDRLAKLAEGYSPANDVQAEMEQIPELRHLVDNRSWMQLIDLAAQLANFPRHVSQHVGGVVISSDPLIDCVPIQPTAWPGRYVCQWDKDDIDDARMVKIDFLALGMLSLVEECLDLCYLHRRNDDGEGDLVDLSRIDFDDHEVYDRICRGDTMGMFQIESRAQAGILPRTKPRQLDDLTAQVAIIRPGPIVGGAVTRFIEGRSDPEHNKAFHHDCLEGVLDRTFGVILFQEQVVQVAMKMGDFTAGEAEQFRRAMSRKDWTPETTQRWREKFLAGAALHDVPEDDARQVFEALIGFAQFGFPESHAAAFGLLAYQTAWLREYYPAEFYCALYNNWPMGFYPPHVFTGDARRHGIEILRPSINSSEAKCTVVASASRPASDGRVVDGRAVDDRPVDDRTTSPMPPFRGTGTIRIGLGFIKEMGSATVNAILEERRRGGPFRSLRDFARRTQLGGEAVENAIRAGAFDELCDRRRELLWQQWLLVKDGRSTAELERSTRPRQLQLDLPTEQDHVHLDEVSDYQAMIDDYEVLGLSPAAHPMQFLRSTLGGPPVLDSRRLLDAPTGRQVDTAGLVVVRQRPGTAKGTVYLLLEDEYGVTNVVVSPRLYDRYRSEIRGCPFLRVRGILDPPAGDTAVLRARCISPVHHGNIKAPNGKSWG